MLEIGSLLRAMARDADVSGRDIKVFIVALDYLDTCEDRPLKLEVVAQQMNIDPSSVSLSLKSLVDGGFLARTGRAGRTGAMQYRIPVSRRLTTLAAAPATSGPAIDQSEPPQRTQREPARRRMIRSESL